MKYPVAIMDYGIGGLGFYNLIKKHHPGLPVIYFSDSGEVPYGKLNAVALRKRITKVFTFLREAGADRIVVACHSGSSVVQAQDVGVIGIRASAVAAVLSHKPKLVGIVGGGRTIRSKYYKDEFERHGIQVKQRVAQELSILVEKGDVSSRRVHKAVNEITRPLKDCDAILLACTHYPALMPVFSQILGPGVQVIDPVSKLFLQVDRDLTYHQGDRGLGSMFVTTGNTRMMAKAAAAAFGVEVGSIKKVSL